MLLKQERIQEPLWFAHLGILLIEVIKMKDDKFKKLSDNEIGKISGGISEPTKGPLGMKMYANWNIENGEYEGMSLRPKKNHEIIDTSVRESLEKHGDIEGRNTDEEINKALDIRR